jgi:hypothetical protein
MAEDVKENFAGPSALGGLGLNSSLTEATHFSRKIKGVHRVVSAL